MALSVGMNLILHSFTRTFVKLCCDTLLAYNNKPKGKINLEDVNIDETERLKWIINRMLNGLIWSRTETNGCLF
jgi:hypothetical protein